MTWEGVICTDLQLYCTRRVGGMLLGQRRAFFHNVCPHKSQNLFITCSNPFGRCENYACLQASIRRHP